MSLKPMSRDAMSALKHAADLEKCAKQVTKLIDMFYQHAIRKAKTSTETSIQLQGYGDFTDSECGQNRIKFTENHKGEVLTGLRTLFPGCVVEYQTLVQGKDGKMYDFSKMDKTMLQFINNQQTREFLVIDWS